MSKEGCHFVSCVCFTCAVWVITLNKKRQLAWLQISNKWSTLRVPYLGGKNRIQWRMCDYHSRLTTQYHLVSPQTIHFRFDRKLKNHRVVSTLHVFKPLAPRLQYTGLRSASNLVHHQNTIIFFFVFALDHTQCHLPYQAQLSSNHMQLPKPLNSTKYHTTTTSLCGPL